MGKEEFKDIPDDIKKRIIMMGIVAGKDLTVVTQRITINDSKIENSIAVHGELVDLLDIEDELQEFRNEFDETFHKFSRSILKKVQAFSKEQGFATVETDKDGNILWPDEPTSFKIDLEDNDD